MGKITAGAIRVGIGGWTYEPWRGKFYPDGLPQKGELEFAGRQLTSIEINGTYYGAQKPATFAKWRDETPEGFVFSVKAPRFVMNRKVLAEAGNAIERFVGGGVLELEDKLGPINWQFLPTKTFDSDDFEAFLKLLPKKAGGRVLRHAIEVRHDSFRTPDFIALARAYGVAIVVAADSSHPQIADATAPFVYVRIMGTEASEPAGYSRKVIALWAKRLQVWAAGAVPEGLECVERHRAGSGPRDVYLYVISGFKAHNPAAAMSIIRQLG